MSVEFREVEALDLQVGDVVRKVGTLLSRKEVPNGVHLEFQDRELLIPYDDHESTATLVVRSDG